MDKRAISSGAVKEDQPTITRSSLNDRDWLFGLGLFLAIVVIYSPVWWAGYVWDDSVMLTENPRMLGVHGLRLIWTIHGADLCPLTLTSLWLEHALWVMNPLPYHLVNVGMFAACALLLWHVLRLLEIRGAWLGTALWAFHPMQVESVAWITEMKNTQSGVFYLLTIFFFVKGLKAERVDDRRGGILYYGLTLLCAAMAMASKSSTVILPAVLCLAAWWVEGRWRWRNLVLVMPLVGMAAISSLVSIWTQHIPLTVEGDAVWGRTWPERLVTAGVTVWFYLGKLLWPHPLIAIYPRWQIDAGQWTSYLPLLMVVLVLLILWLKRESRYRALFFTFAYFLAGLLPVLGLVNMPFNNQSFVADHYPYLASMGPLVLIGAGLTWIADFALFEKLWLWRILLGGLLALLAILSWQRAWVFESEETLWTDTQAKNPSSWAGHHNLSLVLMEKGDIDQAMQEDRKAIAINPDYVDAHINLGIALAQKGDANEGLAQFQKAVEIDPSHVESLINLGIALTQKGDIDAGLVLFEKALKINPRSAQAHYNVGLVLLQKGRAENAIAEYKVALKIDPKDVDVRINLGTVLAQKGRLDEGIVEFQKALEIDPNNAEAHYDLGMAFIQKKQVEAAIAQMQEAVRLNPGDADAQDALAKLQALLRKK